MDKWLWACLPFLLAGCATPEGGRADPSAALAGTLQLLRVGPERAEIELDGKRYVGEWADGRCFTSQCRGEFFNVPKTQRSQVRRGTAELTAADASRLSCAWVSHDQQVIGTCQASDGRRYQLRER